MLEQQKAAVEKIRGGLLVKISALLRDTERLKCGLIDCGRHIKPVIALVISNRAAGERSNQAIHFSAVITLLLQHRLHISDNLVRRQAIVAVDGSIPCVVGVGIVSPRGKPISGVPIIWGTEHEYDIVTVMVVPPVPIVPL